jgi:hypothetical protein
MSERAKCPSQSTVHPSADTRRRFPGSKQLDTSSDRIATPDRGRGLSHLSKEQSRALPFGAKSHRPPSPELPGASRSDEETRGYG